jgi:maleylpyruvate isomerase
MPVERDLAWMAEGYDYFNTQLASIDDARLADPSALPNWTRKHVVAHIALNARGLRRLVHWAATGEVTPMYASPSARVEEIDAFTRSAGPALRDLVGLEHIQLVEALQGLTASGWSAQVATVTSGPVPATVIPWMRVRELWIHAVDLAAGGDFSDFPPLLIDGLIADVVAGRQSPALDIRPTDRAAGDPGPASSIPVEGRASDLARWITGRGSEGVSALDGTPLPELGRWL